VGGARGTTSERSHVKRERVGEVARTVSTREREKEEERERIATYK